MDDGEIDFSDREVFPTANMMDDFSKSSSMESFFDEILKNTHACTHTHTCNPPGPDNTHTHTCFHTHTKLLADLEEEKSVDNSDLQQNSSSKSKKRPLGNREAVRKYREKKKAHTAYLEEEVSHLRALNQQLIKKLQSQASLEAEIMRLRCLLADFRGRIDGELGAYPYQKSTRTDKQGDTLLQPLAGGYLLNSFNLPCDADVPCLHPSLLSERNTSMLHKEGSSIKWQRGCDVLSGNCHGLKVDGTASCEAAACSEDTLTNAVPAAIPSSENGWLQMGRTYGQTRDLIDLILARAFLSVNDKCDCCKAIVFSVKHLSVFQAKLYFFQGIVLSIASCCVRRKIVGMPVFEDLRNHMLPGFEEVLTIFPLLVIIQIHLKYP